ncbi:MAG: adenylate kinase [Candidatus Aenigmarchaeota archaeon]|nr:adenylate kinase [Candidatus Aenigmarchaeota archaeon]
MKVIFLGPPGAGKGTYASRLSKKFGWPHISTGDLIREAIKEGTELGEKAKSYYDKGELVPDDIVMELLKERISREDCKNGFILDGFPRNLSQAKELEKISKIDVVVNIIVPKDIIIKKLSGRRVCRKCGKIYNVAGIRIGNVYLPPMLPKKPGICDVCGGELYQREDDKPEVIEKRFEVYQKQTEPLIKYYRDKGILMDFNNIGPADEMAEKLADMLINWKKSHNKNLIIGREYF